jgi:hypothetical protein
MTDKALRVWIQETHRIGTVQRIELMEDLFLLPEPNVSAFIYFHDWFPTAENKSLQRVLETKGKCGLDWEEEKGGEGASGNGGVDGNGSGNHKLYLFLNPYLLPSFAENEIQ